MKKTFALTHPKKAAARVVETIKHDVKKYIRRERNKTLPAGTDFWDFDCKFGHTEQEAKVIHVKESTSVLMKLKSQNYHHYTQRFWQSLQHVHHVQILISTKNNCSLAII